MPAEAETEFPDPLAIAGQRGGEFDRATSAEAVADDWFAHQARRMLPRPVIEPIAFVAVTGGGTGAVGHDQVGVGQYSPQFAQAAP